MPDQSSAATEHALMQEITAPLATLPDDAMPIVADVDFPIVLRGYDRIAVDAYVKRTSQLVAELQATRSPEAAVRRALERVGEQISGILQRAHDTAAEITLQSRREAEERLEVVRDEAEEIKAAAERRVRELDADTDRIWVERHRIVDDARELARQLLALAESAAERFPAAEETGEQAAVPGAPGASGAEPAGAVPFEVDEQSAAPMAEPPASTEPAGEHTKETERFDPDVTAVLPEPERPEDPPEYQR